MTPGPPVKAAPFLLRNCRVRVGKAGAGGSTWADRGNGNRLAYVPPG